MAAITDHKTLVTLLGRLVDTAHQADDPDQAVAAYARAIATGDATIICPSTAAFHQISDGSCDICGAKNFAE